MTTTADQIVAMHAERKKRLGPVYDEARRVRDAYNGDIVVNIPQMDEEVKLAVANQIQLGIDQMAKRVASTMPHLDCPPLRLDIKSSEDRARDRKRVINGWWEANRLPLHMYQRGRHMLGYGSSPVTVWPDLKNRRPLWVPRDPLGTFPAPSLDPNEICPCDVIHEYTRSLSWLRYRYPDQIARLRTGRDTGVDALFSLLEYSDDDEMVLLVVGAPPEQGVGRDAEVNAGMPHVELYRQPNRAGRCLTIDPTRIVLDRPMSAFEGLVPLMELETRLAALQYIAATKGVFPAEWFVSGDATTAPRIIQKADPMRGVAGLVAGGSPTQQALNPAYTSIQQVDRLDQAIKQQGGIPAEFGGESGTNIRTGRRGDAVLSQTVDFTLQELQTQFGYSLQEENKIAIALAHGYWGDSKQTYYFGPGDSRQRATYIADDTFEDDENLVTYAYAGADTNSLTIEIGQNVGIGILSKKSAMQMHPMVADAEREHDRVTEEALEQAVLQSIQAGAEQGTIPVSDVARIMDLVLSDKESLANAVAKAQDEAQKRQAQQVPPTDPAAQPGLAPPGAGAEATVAPPSPGSENLASLLGALRGPAQTLRGGPEKGA